MSIFNKPEDIVNNLKAPTEAQRIAILIFRTGLDIYSAIDTVKSWRRKNLHALSTYSKIDPCAPVELTNDFKEISHLPIYKLCFDIRSFCDDIIEMYNNKQNINKPVTELIRRWQYLVKYIEDNGQTIFHQPSADDLDNIDYLCEPSYYGHPFEWRVHFGANIEFKIGHTVASFSCY